MLHNVHRNTQKINRYSILNSPFIIPTAIPNKSHSNNPRKNFPTTITAVFTRSPKLSSYRSATFKWVIHFSATLSQLFFPYQTERKKERKNKRERDFSNRIERLSNRGEKDPRICSENRTAVTFELPFICTVKPDPVPPLLSQAGKVGVEKAADKGPDAGVRNNWNVGDVWFISRGFSSHFTQSPRGSGGGQRRRRGQDSPDVRSRAWEGDRRARSRDTTWETSKVTGISDWTGRLVLYRNALIRLAPQFSRVSFFFQCARPTTTTRPPEASILTTTLANFRIR